MKIIDSHVHMDTIERAGLEAMALAGITAVVADAAPVPGLAPSWESVIDFIERNLGYETERANEFFIDVYVMVGINMFFVSRDYEKVLEAIPGYLEQDRVVALGEIGLDPRSQTCPDMALQEEIVKSCLGMAKEYEKAVLFHTPPTEKQKWVDRYFELINDAKIQPRKILISHVDSSILKQVIDFGCIADITVQPWRNISPSDAAKKIQGADLNKIVVDSDSSLRFGSDVLSVPKTALELRRLGFKETDIKKVVYENPISVFGL